MRGKANHPKIVLCVLFLLAGFCTAVPGGVIYVDGDAAGAGNGTSWVDAFTDLQDALVAAQAGDEIRVAQGVYTPTQDPLDRDAAFDLKDGVSILGGFAGLAGMYPDFRHTGFHATILSGDIDRNDDGVDPNTKEGNSRHVVTCGGPGNAAVLDGVTVTGGYAAGDIRPHNYSDGRGGGVFCRSGAPEFINCVFRDNYSGSGAVYVNGGCRPVFTHCIWEDNYANTGAAICVNRSSYLIRLDYCIFRRNTARGKGGAIYADIMGEIQMVNCLLVGNTASDSGGAISCLGHIDGTGRSVFNLLNCTFYGNTSPVFDIPPTNSMENPDGSRLDWSGSMITNCIFYNEPSEMAVSIKFGYREPVIIASIYERQPQSGQPRIVPPAPEVLFADPYGPDGIPGTEDDDLRPAPGSPAIDAGTNQTAPQLPPADLEGTPRILNGIVDIGAYEFTDSL